MSKFENKTREQGEKFTIPGIQIAVGIPSLEIQITPAGNSTDNDK